MNVRKLILTLAVLLTIPLAAQCGNIRAALLDFENQAGLSPDDQLGGKVNTSQLLEKAPLLLAKHLLELDGFELVDRRDFAAAVSQANHGSAGHRRAFIQPAQYLNADVVLRGSLMSLSSSRQTVDLGGHHSEHAELNLSVALEALDVHNGAVLAVCDAQAARKFRQTAGHFSEIGEQDLLDLLEEAIAESAEKLKSQLDAKPGVSASREMVSLTVRSEQSPALVEIDGVLVGSTPMERLSVYKGDHLFRVSRPGYTPVTKRVLLQKDVEIDVALFRSDLDAGEKKEVLKDSDTHVFMGEQVPFLIKEVER